MARPSPESIEIFMSITGASEAVAVQILEEHLNDLNEAVNAYFSEGNRNMVSEVPTYAPQEEPMDIDDVTPSTRRRETPLPFLSTARPTSPFPLFNPRFGGSLLAYNPLMPRPPFITHPREIRQIPIEIKDRSGPSGRSRNAPIIEDVTGTVHAQGLPPRFVDEESDDDIRAASTLIEAAREYSREYNDIEEEMIHAAIEASRMEAGGSRNISSKGRQPPIEDDDRTKAQLEDESDDVDEQPLVRRRSRRGASSQAPPNNDRSRSLEAEPISTHPPDSGYGFASAWGGISAEEHAEALRIEASMYSTLLANGYIVPRAIRSQRMPSFPSPSLTDQRLIREQQDDEYNASLQADREKAIREAEARRVEEEAAKTALLEEEKRKEEEARRKLEEEQELERQLAEKEASLPEEPSADEEDTVTLLVRMPDGTRHGRRFFKSDKLKSLFDFIDLRRVVKPGSYRLVRPYPRCRFSDGDYASTLYDLGLTGKQEALFLELI